MFLDDVDGHGYIPIKLYLQKQVTRFGHCVLIPACKNQTARIKIKTFPLMSSVTLDKVIN